jgi:hypothetical protein
VADPQTRHGAVAVACRSGTGASFAVVIAALVLSGEKCNIVQAYAMLLRAMRGAGWPVAMTEPVWRNLVAWERAFLETNPWKGTDREMMTEDQFLSWLKSNPGTMKRLFDKKQMTASEQRDFMRMMRGRLPHT